MVCLTITGNPTGPLVELQSEIMKQPCKTEYFLETTSHICGVGDFSTFALQREIIFVSSLHSPQWSIASYSWATCSFGHTTVQYSYLLAWNGEGAVSIRRPQLAHDSNTIRSITVCQMSRLQALNPPLGPHPCPPSCCRAYCWISPWQVLQ